MREIRLRGSGIRTTVLGFGCAQLMRLPGREDRQRLLAAAFDAGIRHFDTARSYGLGVAERELAALARGRRDALVIATKFGIRLHRGGSRLAGVQGVARRLIGWFPALRRLARRSTAGLYQPRRYDAESARESLETSLRELGTDYVDLFLLHEPSLADVRETDVLPFLERAREEGKIRAWGVSGWPDDVVEILESSSRLAPLIQVPNDPVRRTLDRLDSGGRSVVTFSPLSGQIGRLLLHLAAPSSRERWSERLEFDLATDEAAASLLVRYCLEANRHGVVIFSTTRADRLAPAISALRVDSAADRAAKRLPELFAAELPPPRSGRVAEQPL